MQPENVGGGSGTKLEGAERVREERERMRRTKNGDILMVEVVVDFG